jgi:hypothetical protein
MFLMLYDNSRIYLHVRQDQTRSYVIMIDWIIDLLGSITKTSVTSPIMISVIITHNFLVSYLSLVKIVAAGECGT